MEAQSSRPSVEQVARQPVRQRLNGEVTIVNWGAFAHRIIAHWLFITSCTSPIFAAPLTGISELLGVPTGNWQFVCMNTASAWRGQSHSTRRRQRADAQQQARVRALGEAHPQRRPGRFPASELRSLHTLPRASSSAWLHDLSVLFSWSRDRCACARQFAWLERCHALVAWPNAELYCIPNRH